VQIGQVPLAVAQDSESARSFAYFSEAGLDALTSEEAVRVSSLLSAIFDGLECIFKLYEKGLVDPKNWERIVVNQLDSWSNPHLIAYICSHPGPSASGLQLSSKVGSRNAGALPGGRL